MTAKDYDGVDFFQFQCSIKSDEFFDRLFDELSSIDRIVAFCIAEEYADVKGPHVNGVIVHTYAQRDRMIQIVNQFFRTQGLNGKNKEYGCLKCKLNKSLEDNLIYVLKTCDNYLYSGFDDDYIESLRGQWKPHVPKKKKSDLNDYSTRLLAQFSEDYSNILEEGAILRSYKSDHDVVTGVTQWVNRHISRLPKCCDHLIVNRFVHLIMSQYYYENFNRIILRKVLDYNSI